MTNGSRFQALGAYTAAAHAFVTRSVGTRRCSTSWPRRRSGRGFELIIGAPDTGAWALGRRR